MADSRPLAAPVFQQPKLDCRPPADQADSAARRDTGRICELPECTRSVPYIRGRDNQVRYCSEQHRKIARLYRRRARHNGEPQRNAGWS